MDTNIVLLTLLLISITCYVLQGSYRKRRRASLRCVAILVLGDVGRSPRMMYHAESFAKAGFRTYLIGYSGSTPIASLERLNVQLFHLKETPRALRRLPFIILAPIKVTLQALTVLHALLLAIPHPPEYIVVQNPPSIPTLALLPVVCALRGCKLIIDWHNLGCSILALKLGEKHTLVRCARIFERTFGRSAFIHLFVTKAMRDSLVKDWGLQGKKVILHDRPPSHFKRAEVFESHNLYNKLFNSETQFSSPYIMSFFPGFSPPLSTPFTQLQSTTDVSTFNAELINPTFVEASSPALRADRPALLVSSTSWTPDEDFGILLDALEQYEKKASELNERRSGIYLAKKLPKLLAIVTGKGPQKKYYMDKVTQLERENNWQWVRCRSLWLEAEDYPLLLGSADLGVSLHSSSSGLDLPMKVVDMFGCGLPVCALNFKCLSELVQDGRNGTVFNSGNELADQLCKLLRGFPSADGLEALRSKFAKSMTHPVTHRTVARGAESDLHGWCSWEENWDHVLKPLLLTDAAR